MISAFRRAEGFRGDAQVTTWLHRIVVNACLDRIRRAAVRRTEPLPEQGEAGPALAGAGGREDRLEREQLRLGVTEALAQIHADQRAAIVLVDMEGCSVEQAATMLGCAPRHRDVTLPTGTCPPGATAAGPQADGLRCWPPMRPRPCRRPWPTGSSRPWPRSSTSQR